MLPPKRLLLLNILIYICVGLMLKHQTKSLLEASLEREILVDLAIQATAEEGQTSGGVQQNSSSMYKEELYGKLPYYRTLSDARHPLCLMLPSNNVATLPTASVIIIFYNEPYSALLRTIHSTLNTCDARVLKEIILVDDGSTNAELAGKLDYYIKTRLGSANVRVLRLSKHSGHNNARLAGARIANGKVFIFLEALSEPNIGWCEPLLQRVTESPTTVAIPIIDTINAGSFEYLSSQINFQIGGFLWDGKYQWINISQRERDRQTAECAVPVEICPTHSPTLTGSIFAVERDYFGKIWTLEDITVVYEGKKAHLNGDRLQVSFRIWQCGGTIEVIPCARVGLVMRKLHTFNRNELNVLRKKLWTNTELLLYRSILEMIAANERLESRLQWKCKNFNWYLRNVYPEKFMPNRDSMQYGRIRLNSTATCLNAVPGNNIKPYKLGVYLCNGFYLYTKFQYFYYTNKRVLRNELHCVTVPQNATPPYHVLMLPCKDNDAYNDKWLYEDSHFINLQTGLCLDYRGITNMDFVEVVSCDRSSGTQFWIIEDH